MSITTGQQKLINRVVTMASPPNIIIPGGKSKDMPRYVIQAAGGSQQTVFRNKGMTDATAEINVRVETGTDVYSVIENDSLVAALVARFPVGASFDGITILDAPLPRPPVTSAGVYAIPVIIRGRFFFK